MIDIPSKPKNISVMNNESLNCWFKPFVGLTTETKKKKKKKSQPMHSSTSFPSKLKSKAFSFVSIDLLWIYMVHFECILSDKFIFFKQLRSLLGSVFSL